MNLPTKYAPAERASDEEIIRHFKVLTTSSLLKDIIDLVPIPFALLNRQRQIILANNCLLDFCGLNLRSIIGLRLGEALKCAHSNETEGGCGTTEHCRYCGALKVILSANKDLTDVQECLINRRYYKDPLSLRIFGSSITISGEKFLAVTAIDISDEKNRKVLERFFYNDILSNTAGIKAIASLLTNSSELEIAEHKRNIIQLSDSVLDEIAVHRDLLAAENNDLIFSPIYFNSFTVLEEVKEILELFNLKKVKIEVDKNSEDAVICSDLNILKKVLVSMLKNAIEASNPDETIILGSNRGAGTIEFKVWNNAYMNYKIQKQIFQRSFSTKGEGRGIGTYSMKLFTERYLNGNISFTSDKEKGTTFICSIPVNLR